MYTYPAAENVDNEINLLLLQIYCTTTRTLTTKVAQPRIHCSQYTGHCGQTFALYLQLPAASSSIPSLPTPLQSNIWARELLDGCLCTISPPAWRAMASSSQHSIENTSLQSSSPAPTGAPSAPVVSPLCTISVGS